MRPFFIFLIISTIVGGTYLGIFIWYKKTINESKKLIQVEEIEYDANLNLKFHPIYNIAQNVSEPDIQAKAWILIDADSGQILSSKNAQESLPVASTTKMITSLAVRRANINVEDEVIVTSEAARQEGSIAGILQGQKYSVRELIEATLLNSGNDSAYLLAEYVGGKLLSESDSTSFSSDQKVQKFISLMNGLALELGLANSKFQDPAGLEDAGRSSAHDLAKILTVILQDKFLRNIINTSDKTIHTIEPYEDQIFLHNTNRLLKDQPFQGMIGGKTGFTNEAGHCLIVAANQKNITLVASILFTDEDSKNASANEAQKLLTWGYKYIQKVEE